MRKVSIRIQIMLWYTLLTAILLAVSLPVLYGAMAGSLRRDQEAYLRSAAGQLASHIEWEDGDLKLLNDLDLPAGTQYLLTTESGGRIVSSENAWADAPGRTRPPFSRTRSICPPPGGGTSSTWIRSWSWKGEKRSGSGSPAPTARWSGPWTSSNW